jgi:sulfoxide reductase heme-binding subunit YedZ
VNKTKSTYIGLILLLLFLIQFVMDFKWDWLYNLQQDEMFKRWSGLGLSLFIAFQWSLTLCRIIKKFKKYAFKITNFHKWIGAISPLLFYLHSMELGYGYLALLSYVFLTNTLIGYFNLDVIKSTHKTLFKGWMIVHVVYSIIITLLMVFHIGVVFYYK